MILNVKEACQATIDFLNKTSYSLVRSEFSKYDMIYSFTTENLSYLEQIDVRGKSVLTVTGSFDQALNLIFEGANSICNFDVNQLSVYFSHFKMAAMKEFSYEEYLEFFLGEKSLDYSMYLRLKKHLSDSFIEYFDFLYKTFSYSGEAILSSRLFDSVVTKEKVVLSNPYLKSKENYNLTKQRLDSVSISFEEKNLLEIGNGSSMYDLMLFSNIESYLVDDVYSTMSQEEFLSFIKDQASKQLNAGGVIQIAYNYGYAYKDRSVQNTKNILKKILERNNKLYNKKDYLEEFKKLVFMGYTLNNRIPMSPDMQDCVYLYVHDNLKKDRF